MNKSRRMASRLLHRLAAESIGALIFDPYGTGDSPGEFSDATWDTWMADTLAAARFLREQGADEIIAVALRGGSLLAIATHAQLCQLGMIGMVLWQPVVSGAAMLNQLLRMRLAARMDGDGGRSRETGAQLRERLAAGEIVEVGGYGLSGGLVGGMQQVDLLDSGIAASVAVAWAELVPQAGRAPLPASLKVIEAWREHGVDVRTRTLVGPQFWSTAELADVPELIDWSVATIHAIADSAGP
jgi:exosortase A-associated hydrolase 2